MEKKKETKRKMFEIVTRNIELALKIIETIEFDYENGFIVDYAYILHDKDVYTRLDQEDVPGKQIGDKKENHYHIGFRTKNSNSFKTISNRYDVQENLIEKIKSNRFSDYLAYLTHANAKEKFQYDDKEVITTIENWIEIRNAKMATNRALEESEMFDLFMEQAANGEITRADIGVKISKVFYAKKKNFFDNAFKLAQEEKAKEINLNGIDKKIIYVNGSSGSGKTTYAKQFAIRHGLSFYVSGSSNDLLDGYTGEECIILDDIRGQNFELSDLLKLIDNNTASEYKSRYNNKLVTAKVIIITSIQSLNEFMRNIQTKNKEDLKQVRRRIKVKIEMDKENLKVYSYDKETDSYILREKGQNNILDFIKQQNSKEEYKSYLI